MIDEKLPDFFFFGLAHQTLFSDRSFSAAQHLQDAPANIE